MTYKKYFYLSYGLWNKEKKKQTDEMMPQSLQNLNIPHKVNVVWIFIVTFREQYIKLGNSLHAQDSGNRTLG